MNGAMRIVSIKDEYTNDVKQMTTKLTNAKIVKGRRYTFFDICFIAA
jgi:hypothetical protein